MNDTRTALDMAMEEIAKEHCEQPFCFTHETLLTCPCCGGSGEHVNVRTQEPYDCAYCKSKGEVRVVRI